MSFDRRQFLLGGGVGLLAASLGCRAPALVRVSRRAVTRTFTGAPSVDGAGVRLTRIVGPPVVDHLDPFVLLDRIHSASPADYVRGFPSHPHRGFETVTVMLEGRFRHQDSRGNRGVITGGGAQWMTAGRGIVHSEMPDQTDGLLSTFQFWVNLPAREKMRAQEYQDLAPEKLAEARLSASGSALRVLAGRTHDLVGPVRERTTEPVLATVRLEDDAPLELDLPPAHAAFAFVHEGEVAIGAPENARRVPEGTLAVLSEGNRLRLRAENRRSVVIVAAGRPLREPIARRGPFVMNTDAELRKAIEDYNAGVLDA